MCVANPSENTNIHIFSSWVAQRKNQWQNLSAFIMGAVFHHNYDVDVMLGGLVVESAEGQWQNSSIFILLVLATHAGLATIIIITIIICLPYIYIIICIPAFL